jgi:hypothetical protein
MNKPIDNTLFADVAPSPDPRSAPSPAPVQPDPKAVAAVEMLAVAAKPAPEPGGDIDWTSANPDIVVPCQPTTAVYENPYGAIVIRQEAPYPDDDPFVFIRPEYLPALIGRLQTFLADKPAGDGR